MSCFVNAPSHDTDSYFINEEDSEDNNDDMNNNDDDVLIDLSSDEEEEINKSYHFKQAEQIYLNDGRSRMSGHSR